MTISKEQSLTVWKNPYVTDGLIAMWDGIWNAGVGNHDPDATCWTDLVGGIRMGFRKGFNLPEGSFKWQDHRLVANGVVSDFSPEDRLKVISMLQPSRGAIEFIVAKAVQRQFDDRPYIGGIWQNGPYSLYFDSHERIFMFSQRIEFSKAIQKIDNVQKTFSFSAADGNCILRVNGGNEETKTAGLASGDPVPWPDSMHLIGNEQSPIFDFSSYCKFAVIRIYDRALTAEEALHNYQVDKERFGI